MLVRAYRKCFWIRLIKAQFHQSLGAWVVHSLCHIMHKNRSPQHRASSTVIRWYKYRDRLWWRRASPQDPHGTRHRCCSTLHWLSMVHAFRATRFLEPAKTCTIQASPPSVVLHFGYRNAIKVLWVWRVDHRDASSADDRHVRHFPRQCLATELKTPRLPPSLVKKEQQMSKESAIQAAAGCRTPRPQIRPSCHPDPDQPADRPQSDVKGGSDNTYEDVRWRGTACGSQMLNYFLLSYWSYYSQH